MSTRPSPKQPQTLPGLGPKSMAMLEAAGIHDLARLQQLGSVAAYRRVKRCCPSASLNLLWALEGALTGLHWQTVARDHRTSLLLALDDDTQTPEPCAPGSASPETGTQ